ncbi:putative ubiquitin-conjugating enzyme protein 17 [Aphelenchoides besseyi]|nr:putative ubiquitin-conjugating enzyme protein 17 [Aphelenchoides besseyi]
METSLKLISVPVVQIVELHELSMQIFSRCFSNRRDTAKKVDVAPSTYSLNVDSINSSPSSTKNATLPMDVQSPHQRSPVVPVDIETNCALENGRQKILAFVYGSKNVVLSTARAIGRGVMGSTNTTSNNEPDDLESQAARLLSLLTQRPNRMSDMLRVIAILGECAPAEKQEFVRLGVFSQLLKEIDQSSHLNHPNAKGLNDEKRKPRPSTGNSSAKGVGFGRGSTKSRWDFERNVEERIAQEEHLMWLLCALTTFLCGDTIKLADMNADLELPKEQPTLPPESVDELINSVILELFEYHFTNDSVFDISQHMDFYQALIELATALAFVPQFLPRLIVPKDAESRSIIKDVLPRFRSTLNQYPNTIRGQSPDSGLLDFCRRCNDLGDVIKKLAQRHEQRLPPEKRIKTANIAQRVLRTSAGRSEVHGLELGIPSPSIYVESLQPFQITTYRLLDDHGKPIHTFAFKKELRNVNPYASSLKERTKRIAKELASLYTGLPLSKSSSIFLCMDESRCDVLKVLISGPENTPYQNGLFEFDVFFPSSYPNSPPKINFLTTGGNTVRFNPNLYNCGKICLSLLNTWEGRAEEKWTPFCSLLQVLVSIQGLIFVDQPYFNEPGFEKFADSPKGLEFSQRYNLHIEAATMFFAIFDMAKSHTRPYFKEVIRRHFWLKRQAVIAQAEKWLKEMSNEKQSDYIEPDTDSGVENGSLNPLVQRQNVLKLISYFNEMQNPFESDEFI